MRIEKLNNKIVCDVLGCAELSEYRLVYDGKCTFNLCPNCFAELKKALLSFGGKTNDKR